MTLINLTPEEAEAEYVKAISVYETLKEELEKLILTKQLGIPVHKHIDNEGEEE